MAFRLSDSDEPIADINVTPLVDVMLVLLIIFMITAPMLTQGVSIRLPEERAQEFQQDSQEAPLILSIRGDRAIFIGEDPIAAGVLEERLKARLAARKDKTVYLKADRELEYGYVVELLASLSRAGIDNIGMVTDLPKKAK